MRGQPGPWTHFGTFGRRLVATAGTNVALALVGVLTSILAARLLGPQGRGELAAIQTWPSIIATLSMLGLPDAVIYFSAREPERGGRHLGSAIMLGFLASVVLGVMAFTAMPLLLAEQSSGVVTAARWYLLLGPLFALVGMPFHSLQGGSQFRAWNALRMTPAVGWLLVLTMAWVFEQQRAEFVAGSYLVFLGVLFIPVVFTVASRVRGPFWPDAKQWAPLLRYGLLSASSGLPSLLTARFDQVVIAAVLPASALGLYVVAVGWGGAANPLLSALGAVVFPAIAAERIPERQAQWFTQGAALTLLLSVAVGIPLLLATPLAVPFLYGEAFANSVSAALVMSAAGTVAATNGALSNGLRGLGCPAAAMKAELGGLGVLAILLPVLLRPFGIIGAALASLLANLVTATLLVRQARRLIGLRPLALVRWPLSEEVSGRQP